MLHKVMWPSRAVNVPTPHLLPHHRHQVPPHWGSPWSLMLTCDCTVDTKPLLAEVHHGHSCSPEATLWIPWPYSLRSTVATHANLWLHCGHQIPPLWSPPWFIIVLQYLRPHLKQLFVFLLSLLLISLKCLLNLYGILRFMIEYIFRFNY